MIYSNPVRALIILGATFLVGNTIYVHYRQRRDESTGFAGVVVDRGVSFTFGRHDFPQYVILRHADGSTEKRYVRREDYLVLSRGDSIEKLPAEPHIRVIRPAAPSAGRGL